MSVKKSVGTKEQTLREQLAHARDQIARDSENLKHRSEGSTNEELVHDEKKEDAKKVSNSFEVVGLLRELVNEISADSPDDRKLMVPDKLMEMASNLYLLPWARFVYMGEAAVVAQDQFRQLCLDMQVAAGGRKDELEGLFLELYQAWLGRMMLEIANIIITHSPSARSQPDGELGTDGGFVPIENEKGTGREPYNQSTTSQGKVRPNGLHRSNTEVTKPEDESSLSEEEITRINEEAERVKSKLKTRAPSRTEQIISTLAQNPGAIFAVADLKKHFKHTANPEKNLFTNVVLANRRLKKEDADLEIEHVSGFRLRRRKKGAGSKKSGK